jgi:hypothetical protein
MKIQVIANCQARPVSTLVPLMAPGAETLEPIVVHLAKAEEESAHLAQIAQADVIFTQLLQDQFKPAHLATRNLKERFGDKVVVWPNIFYMGQQPYLRYFTHPQHGRLMGPLDALHDIRLYRSWKETGRVDPTALDYSDPDFIAAARTASLRELQAKEALCDVRISDFLTAYEDSERLFFTFNHPSQFVLLEMVQRLLGAVTETDPRMSGPPEPEPLDRFQVPSVWNTADAVFQGNKFEIDNENKVLSIGGPPQPYSRDALCAAYQQTNDANDIYRTFEDIRLTPNFPSDAAFLNAA